MDNQTAGTSKISQQKVESAFLRVNKEEQNFHRHLTLGVEEKLRNIRMIKDVKLLFRNPVEKSTLSCWERKHGVSLPADLKDYYSSTNGFKLTWALEHAGDLLRFGDMNINPLNQLLPIIDNANVNPSSSNSCFNSGNSTNYSLIGAYDDGKSFGLNHGNSSMSNPRKGDLKRKESYLEVSFDEFQQTLNSSRLTHPMKNCTLAPELTLGPKGKAFVLESVHCGWGRVCLVYPNLKSRNDKEVRESNTLNEENPFTIENKSGRKSNSAKIVLPSMEKLKVPTVSSITSFKTGKEAIATKTVTAEPQTMEIWFLDPSFQWHYLAPTFTHYYRMLLIHLGLPQWHYRFTPFGLCGWAEQIFWLVAPHLLQSPKISKFPSLYHDGGLWSTDVPTEASAPNPTNNVLSNQLFRRKKKPTQQ